MYKHNTHTHTVNPTRVSHGRVRQPGKLLKKLTITVLLLLYQTLEERLRRRLSY